MSEKSSTAGADTAPDTESDSAPETSSADARSATTGVSMRKALLGGSSRSPRKELPPQVPAPLMINIITAAIVAMVAGTLARGLLLLGNTPSLLKYVTDTNTKAKKPDKNFNAVDAVHTLREGALIQAAIFGVALLLLAYAMRRTRSASATRWAVLIIFIYTGMPFYVIPTNGLPPAVQAAGVVIGVSSIAAILLIFVPPQSQKYFRDCREMNRPPEQRGQPKTGGLASLFAPKRPRGEAPARGGGLFGGGARAAAAARAAKAAPPTERPARPVTAKAKAKVRSNSDAIAKGAELARLRAKASKSRRTPD